MILIALPFESRDRDARRKRRAFLVAVPKATPWRTAARHLRRATSGSLLLLGEGTAPATRCSRSATRGARDGMLPDVEGGSLETIRQMVAAASASPCCRRPDHDQQRAAT